MASYFESLTTREQTFIRNKWEFMRRDKAVKSAIERARQYLKNGGGRDCVPDDIYKEVVEPINGNSVTFNIGTIAALDCRIKFDDMLAALLSCSDESALVVLAEYSFVNFLSPRRCFSWEAVPHDAYVNRGAYPNIYLFEVDFNYVNSISALKKELELQLACAYNGYVKRMKESGKNVLVKTTKDIEKPELIIKAGDLHFQKRLSVAEVTRQVFPEALNDSCAEDDPWKARGRVQGYIKRYEELTSGGWRGLVYP